MGTEDDIGFEADGEGLVRRVHLDEFHLDKFAATNAQFYQFVDKTGCTTEADSFGWSDVFKNHLTEAAENFVLHSISEAPWWRAVEGACWYRPFGPESGITHPLKQSVDHVSWNDAAANGEWGGKRHPTEAEWEYAARGGLSQKHLPWGDPLRPTDEYRCNVWQGNFPDENTARDGYDHTCPVKAFEPIGHGLSNVVGNVWDWCEDWWTTGHRDAPENNLTGPIMGDA